MALVDKVVNIADAIRTKTSTTDKMTLDEMVTNIGNIDTEGTSYEVTGSITGHMKQKTSTGYVCEHITVLTLPSTTITMSGTRMNQMFTSFSALKSLDCSMFNTSSCTQMNYIFYGCSSLEYLDISSWDFSSLTRWDSPFYDCTSLRTIKWPATVDFSNITTGVLTLQFYINHDSAVELFNALVDYPGTGVSGFKLPVAYSTLTEEEIAIATNKGYTVSE